MADTETRIALLRDRAEKAERRAMTLSRRVDELLARIAKLEAERDQS